MFTEATRGYVRNPPTLTRRELNKQNTRQALIDAAFQVLQENGYDATTVDMVASRAEVSRRTFFNYFPSLNAALLQHVEQLLGTALGRVSADIGLMDVVDSAIAEMSVDESFAPVALVHFYAQHSPSLMADSLLVWEDTRRRLTEHFIALHSNADPLEVAVAVHAVLGGLYSAYYIWSRTLECEPTEDDIASLGVALRRAVGILRSGVEL